MSQSINGIGIGLRKPFAKELLALQDSPLRFLELHPENYVSRGGRYQSLLEQAWDRFPILTHGLSLCLGNAEPFESSYCRDLREFLHKRVTAPWHTEHLCFNGAHGATLHDLVPVPFNRQSIAVASERIRELQDRIELPLAFENVSFYIHLAEPEMEEIAFINEVIDRTQCKLLLDVNNVYVNSINHGFDPYAYIDQLPMEAVVHIHVAGHLVKNDGLIIDTHAEPVCEGVYKLLEYTLQKKGPVPVLLERDGNFPEFSELLQEVHRLDNIYQRAMKQRQAQHGTPAEAAAI